MPPALRPWRARVLKTCRKRTTHSAFTSRYPSFDLTNDEVSKKTRRRSQNDTAIRSATQASRTSSRRAKTDHLVHAVDHVLHVALVQACKRDPARLQEVDVVLRDETLALSLRQAGEGKHAYLVCDVVPRTGGALCLETCPEQAADLEDALSHRLELALPCVKSRRVPKDPIHEQGAVDGRARVHRADDHLKLRQHRLGLVGFAAHHVEHAPH